MNRQELIYALTKYELEWFIHNGHPWIEDTTKFFADGGFHSYSDEQLQKKYDLDIAEEVC
jgi:N-acetylglutamate synthase-like GNAT family acetyltransferase